MAPKHEESTTTRLDLSHLRREARTALELAIVELAPNDLIDRLALVTGLLEALAELPANSAPAIALDPPRRIAHASRSRCGGTGRSHGKNSRSPAGIFLERTRRPVGFAPHTATVPPMAPAVRSTKSH